MGADRAADSSGEGRRQDAHGGDARGRQRAYVRFEHGMSVARYPEGPAAEEHGVWLL